MPLSHHPLHNVLLLLTINLHSSTYMYHLCLTYIITLPDCVLRLHLSFHHLIQTSSLISPTFVLVVCPHSAVLLPSSSTCDPCLHPPLTTLYTFSPSSPPPPNTQPLHIQLTPPHHNTFPPPTPHPPSSHLHNPLRQHPTPTLTPQSPTTLPPPLPPPPTPPYPPPPNNI
jgi:hypothetical protein